MKIKLIFSLLIIYSSLFAQNSSSSTGHLKTDMKLFGNNNPHDDNVIIKDIVINKGYSIFNVAGQTIVGTGLMFGCAFIPMAGAFAHSFSRHTNQVLIGALGILTVSSYVFGAGLGVYWVAHVENKELSFWNTIGYSAIGGGGGAVLISVLAMQYKNKSIPAFGGTVAALSPLIGAMVYSLFITDWPGGIQTAGNNNIFSSHIDYVDLTKVIEINLLRINL